MPSELRRAEIKACVVLKPGKAPSPEELVDWCRERLAHFKVPRYIEYRESLPKTPTGKVQKHKLTGDHADPTEGCYDRGERPDWYHA